MEKSKAVFLDRDGTLIEEVDFLSRAEDLRLFSFTYDAVRRLKDAGYLLIVITNQSGIGRGLFTENAMHAIHQEIQAQLDNMIDAFYFCPHLPDEGCACRKPGIGMIEAACDRFSIDLDNSWVVGDKTLDVGSGANAGLSSILVRTGYGAEHENILPTPANFVADNLMEAVAHIIEPSSR